jgi:hypothetical protein
MALEGKISRENTRMVLVHVLDPVGPVRADLGLGAATSEYYTQNWVIGKEVTEDTVARFLDPETPSTVCDDRIKDGKPQTHVLAKQLWDEVRRQARSL